MVKTWREQRRGAHAEGRPRASDGSGRTLAPAKSAPPAAPAPPDRWRAEEDAIVGSKDVEALIQLALSLAPDFARHVEQYRHEILHRFGGGRLYIGQHVDTARRNAAIRRDYLKGEHFGLLERRYGLCKRQLINIIKG